MAIKKSKEVNFELGDAFIKDFSSLMDDFDSITRDKIENIVSYRKEFDEVDGRVERIDIFKKMSQENLKHHQFRVAMFNYLNSIFERHINKLIEQSIISNKLFREKCLNKLIEYDEEKIKKNEKTIRNFKWESASKNEKNQILIKNFKELFYKFTPILGWQFFFGVEDDLMWSDKNLRLDFTEIRARRNLLTHRGSSYDREYVDNIQHVTKSKNVFDPQKRISELFAKGYFILGKFDAEKHNNLLKLIDEKNTKVPITNAYFFHTFSVFTRIYCKLWNKVTNSSDLNSQLTHELLVLGHKTGSIAFPRLALIISNEFYEFFFTQKADNTLFKVNYLLLVKELQRNTSKVEVPEFLNERTVKFRKDIETDHADDAIFKVLLNVLDDDLDAAMKNLEKCNDLMPGNKDWIMFTDMRKRDDFSNIFNDSCKK